MEQQLVVVWNGTIDRQFQRHVPQEPVRHYDIIRFTDKPTPTQDRILAVLQREGALTRKQVLERLDGLSFAAVSSAIDKMLGLGLLTASHQVRYQSKMPSWAYKVAE